MQTTCTLYSFADPKDTVAVNEALRALSDCVQQVQKWMQLSMLKLNSDKTEFIVFSSPRFKHLLSDISLKISDSTILSPGTSVKILGVTLDSVMKMDQHVTSLCRSLHYHLSNIARIRPYNKEACGHAVRTLISTRLDYANSLLFGIRAVLPYFGKRKQVTKVTFLVKEQNVSVICTDVNGIS